jgi:multicomponent Na+:H+ antiporter subunit C
MMISSYNYWASIMLMMIGFFCVATSGNLVKKLMGLSIFQVSVLLFYVSVGYVRNGNIPILKEGAVGYVNPLPHVLMLTAIVVGVAVMAVGLAIAVRIKEEYGSIHEDEISNLDIKKHKRESKGK